MHGFCAVWWHQKRYIQLHPPIPDGFSSNKVCRCLLWSWIHVSTTLNHPKRGRNDLKKRNAWVLCSLMASKEVHPASSTLSWWISMKQSVQMSSMVLNTCIHHLNQPFVRSGAGETAASVHFDLMGHQCHHRTVAPPAPQPLGQFLCSLCEHGPNTPL